MKAALSIVSEKLLLVATFEMTWMTVLSITHAYIYSLSSVYGTFPAVQCPWAVTGKGGQNARAAVAVRAAYTSDGADFRKEPSHAGRLLCFQSEPQVSEMGSLYAYTS